MAPHGLSACIRFCRTLCNKRVNRRLGNAMAKKSPWATPSGRDNTANAARPSKKRYVTSICDYGVNLSSSSRNAAPRLWSQRMPMYDELLAAFDLPTLIGSAPRRGITWRQCFAALRDRLLAVPDDAEQIGLAAVPRAHFPGMPAHVSHDWLWAICALPWPGPMSARRHLEQSGLERAPPVGVRSAAAGLP
jgi:hypothetical protein